MALTRRRLLGATVVTLPFAGCTSGSGSAGGGGGGGNQPTTTEPADSGDSTPTGTETATDAGMDGATVAVSPHPDHGEILVGPDGMTLYMFDQDTRGEPASTCYEGCAEAWPPLTVEGEPTAGEGVSAELTTFERDDGSTQVAAGGWPLYHFASDSQPGDATGQGVNDVWWVLRPDGTPAKPDQGTATGTNGAYN